MTAPPTGDGRTAAPPLDGILDLLARLQAITAERSQPLPTERDAWIRHVHRAYVECAAVEQAITEWLITYVPRYCLTEAAGRVPFNKQTIEALLNGAAAGAATDGGSDG